ncbi:hypothetical protein KKC97_10370 [bacterium]|nr:hypothetical protein [bacterium]
MAIFGEAGFGMLRESFSLGIRGTAFDSLMLEELRRVINKQQHTFVLPLAVELDKRKHISHYLVFLSKNKLGFKVMRDIMIKRSLKDADGMPLYVFSSIREEEGRQIEIPGLFGPRTVLQQLSDRLLGDFKGSRIEVGLLLERCLEKGYEYNDSHVRKGLIYLQSVGKIGILHNGVKTTLKRILNRDVIEFGASGP